MITKFIETFFELSSKTLRRFVVVIFFGIVLISSNFFPHQYAYYSKKIVNYLVQEKKEEVQPMLDVIIQNLQHTYNKNSQ